MSTSERLIIDPTVVKNWNTDDNPDGKALNITIDVPKHLSFAGEALEALLLARIKDDRMPRGFNYGTSGGIEEGRDEFHVTLTAECLEGRGKWATSLPFKTEDIKRAHTNIPTAKQIDLGVANVMAAQISHMIDAFTEGLPKR
jgi:hypothetical protein